jgi:cytochrome c553
MKTSMPSIVKCALLLALVGMGPAMAASVTYTLPPETAALKDGPNQDVAIANCTGCHSADYIATQPHGPKFAADFWQAEVTKMIKAYGAPIQSEDVPKIVDYLTKTYAVEAK